MIELVSFSYRQENPPTGYDIIDCRYLPNPHGDKNLRGLTGLDIEVQEWLLSKSPFEEFLNAMVTRVLLGVAPAGVAPNTPPTPVRAAFGCVGGRHRSVAAAFLTGERVASEMGVDRESLSVVVCHRALGVQKTAEV